jgi:hypothetical protein
MTQKFLFTEGVANVFSNIPVHPKSHVRGWAQHWAETLGPHVKVFHKGDSLDGLDVIYFDHGVNATPGKMNLFSGITEDCVDRMEQILSGPSMSIVSLDFPMPVDEYVHALRQRVGLPSSSKRLTSKLAEAFAKVLQKNRGLVMLQEDFIDEAGSFVIGDSHSTAFAEKGEPVLRRNGLTLKGALKNNVFLDAVHTHYRAAGKITFVAGSIDIRHHVGLQKDPEDYVEALACDLIEQASDFEEKYSIEPILAAPVPVEHESRRIPKTGWLNDRPFMGEQFDRAAWTQIFIKTLVDQCAHPIVLPPNEWYEMDPADYANSIMELSSSVHIAPTHYRRLGGWGFTE